MRAREFAPGDKTATGEQVWAYIRQVHPPEESTPFLERLVKKWPRYALREVPLGQLAIPPAYYPDDAEGEERVDPYGRTLWIDYDHAGEVSAHNVDRLPIVVDPHGHIIDGNHRAWAARELMDRNSIKAWVAVPETNENFADGKKPGRRGLSKRVGIPKKATLAQLEKIAKSSTGERRRMAQWQLNMRRGRNRSK